MKRCIDSLRLLNAVAQVLDFLLHQQVCDQQARVSNILPYVGAQIPDTHIKMSILILSLSWHLNAPAFTVFLKDA